MGGFDQVPIMEDFEFVVRWPRLPRPLTAFFFLSSSFYLFFFLFIFLFLFLFLFRFRFRFLFFWRWSHRRQFGVD